MVLGMVNFAIASPLSREMTGVESYDGRSNLKNQKKVTASNRVIGAVEGGCWSQPNQGPDLYFQALHESGAGNCSPLLGEETGRMETPGCSILRTSGHGISSGQCGVDEQLVTNFGHLIVYSSDQVLGRVDILENPSGPENSLSRVISDNHQENKSWNKLSPSIELNHAPMTKALRYDRMSTELFDSESTDGGSPNLSFDHQLVMSGKLAHLVPKVGHSPRSLELGDLVILLLFAMVPEKKHIKYFIHRTRQLRLF
jgi:hypothetical protein